MELNGAWEYRWGDSPTDPQGFVWASEPFGAPGWASLAFPGIPHDRPRGDEFLWERTRLPSEGRWNAPALFVPVIDQLAEVFLDGRLIYRFGDLASGRFAGYPWHMIPLGSSWAGKTLTFRIRSSHVNIGITAGAVLGSERAHHGAVVRSSVDGLVASALLLFLGVLGGILWIVRRERLHGQFALVCLGFGAFLSSYAQPARFLLLDRPLFWIHLEVLALHSLGPFMMGFIDALLGGRVLRWAWRLTGPWPLVAAGLTLAGVPVMKTLPPGQVLLLVNTVIGLVVVGRHAVQGNVDARLVAGGFALLCLSAVHDVLTTNGFLPWGVRLTMAGVVMLMMSLAAVLVRRFFEVHRQLAQLSRSLEHLLEGTREMSSERDLMLAVGHAAEHLVRDLAPVRTADTWIYFLDRNRSDRCRGHRVLAAGKPVVEDAITRSLFAFPEAQSALEKGRCVITARKELLVPVLWGEARLGFLLCTPLASEALSEAEQRFVEALAASLGVALENIHFLGEAETKGRLEVELQAAQAVQESLLPTPIEVPGLELAASYRSAAQTSGDWYFHHYHPTLRQLDVLVGDVTGHGAPAALLSGVVCGTVRNAFASLDRQLIADAEQRLREVCAAVNRVIYQTSRGQMSMTMIFLSIDLTTGEAVAINAGSPYPSWRKQSGTVTSIGAPGSRLGDHREPRVEAERIRLSVGDTLFLFTDGLVENRGPDGGVFHERALRRLLREDGPAQVLQQRVLEAARGVWRDEEPADDVTTLVLRWTQQADGALQPREAQRAS